MKRLFHLVGDGRMEAKSARWMSKRELVWEDHRIRKARQKDPAQPRVLVHGARDDFIAFEPSVSSSTARKSSIEGQEEWVMVAVAHLRRPGYWLTRIE